ncbi:growth/differentiation factor 8-like [Diadema setosum]|uniref:growth/differentiation factor 8-like n=1 Tax=Diadema setosum TaxID=31175 RepID=UPI003B3B8C12
MTQNSQPLVVLLLIVELVTITIASHPPSWRRHMDERSANIIPRTEVSDEDSTFEASDEVPTDGGHTPNPVHQSPDGGSSASETTTTQFMACPRCVLQQQQKQYRIDSIKRQILEKFKMTKPPNVTRQALSNPAINHIIRRYTGWTEDPMLSDSPGPRHEPREQSQVNYEQILLFAKKPPQQYENEISHRLYFNVAEKTKGYRVTSAKLHYYVAPAAVIQTTLHRMTVEKVMAPANGESNAKLHTVAIVKVPLNLRRGEWRSIDFTNVVQGWAADPDTNMGVYLQLYDDGGNPVVITSTTPEDPMTPFLELSLSDAHRNRQRRQADHTCSEDAVEQHCCKYQLLVDFAQIGWDWIISPRQYFANYCSGSCPNHYSYQYPHTQLVSQMGQMAVTGPCCSSSLMSPIQILMFDDDMNIIFAEVQDMVVDSCGCS